MIDVKAMWPGKDLKAISLSDLVFKSSFIATWYAIDDVFSFVRHWWCIQMYTPFMVHSDVYAIDDVFRCIRHWWCIQLYTSLMMYSDVYAIDDAFRCIRHWWCIQMYTPLMMSKVVFVIYDEFRCLCIAISNPDFYTLMFDLYYSNVNFRKDIHELWERFQCWRNLVPVYWLKHLSYDVCHW